MDEGKIVDEGQTVADPLSIKGSVPPSVPRVENRGAFANNLRFPRDRFAVAGLPRGSRH
jgi:hypothetical protein